MFKKVCSLLLATTMLTGLCSTLTANAAEKEELKHTPNVSSLTLKSDKNVSRFVNVEGEEVNLSDSNTNTFLRRRISLPSEFDLRKEGRSTSVKNQGEYGFCWSFASTASMESNIITKKLDNMTSDKIDLSETGGAWFSSNGTTDKSDSTYGDHRDDPYNGTMGGTAELAAESISSGYGAYPEELIKYEDVKDGYSEALRYYSDYKFKDYSKLPEDFNLIKQRLMENGAMYYTYKSFDLNYYTTEDGVCTYSDNGESIYGEQTDSGHAVTLIGWDDSFSKDNFHPDAGVKNDGAWLCKNSYGEDWGNDGYFWVSYESFVYDFGQFEMQDKDSFDTIHQHQTSGDKYLFGGNAEENPQYFSSANVFTAETSEELEQICYTTAVNSNVKVKIFKLNKNYTSPVDGKLLAQFDSNVEYAGTHCLDVPNNITFSEGDKFSVVIEGENLVTNFRLEDAEHPANDKAGKSYFSDNGEDWTDVADYSQASYATIKAYTTKSSVDKTELTNLVKSIKEFKPSNEAERNSYDNNYSDMKPLLEKAEKLLSDDNVTNTDLKNFCCILKAQWEIIDVESFSVDNLYDLKTLYDGLHSRKFKNMYVELNTDLDLSGFVIEEPDSGDEDDERVDILEYLNSDLTVSNFYFDGKGHTIKNSNINNLFSNLSNSTIKNLNLENCNVEDKNEKWRSSLLVGHAVNSEFININVNNSTVNSSATYEALLAGESSGCTFIDCTAENCNIVGVISGLLFSDKIDSNELIPGEAINCKTENYAIYSYFYVDDNMGFICTYQTDTEETGVCIKVTDNECTITQFCGNLKSVKLNGVDIIPVDSEYHFEKTNGYVVLDVECSYDEPHDFGYITNLESRTVEVTAYSGTDKDIVIPEKIYGMDVVGLSGIFDTFSIPRAKINSVTVPGVIKSIPKKFFTQITGLKKIILNNGVEEIGDKAFYNCEQLNEINLSDSIRTIGNNAFYNCGAKSIALGKNIQFIGDHALGYYETDSGVLKIEGFTIYGYKGTVAETYANANGFSFVDLSV